MKLSIVIPARNEAGNIGLTIEGLREVLKREAIDYEIVLVDAGSRDTDIKSEGVNDYIGEQ